MNMTASLPISFRGMDIASGQSGGKVNARLGTPGLSKWDKEQLLPVQTHSRQHCVRQRVVGSGCQVSLISQCQSTIVCQVLVARADAVQQNVLYRIRAEQQHFAQTGTLFFCLRSDCEYWSSIKIPVLFGQTRCNFGIHLIRIRRPPAADVAVGVVVFACDVCTWLPWWLMHAKLKETLSLVY